MSVYDYLAKIKARQARGGGWIQFVLNIGIITANIALFQSWFAQFGLSLQTMLIAGTIGYFALTVIIGYVDEQYGIWQQENAYNMTLNPWFTDLKVKVDELHANQKSKP